MRHHLSKWDKIRVRTFFSVKSYVQAYGCFNYTNKSDSIGFIILQPLLFSKEIRFEYPLTTHIQSLVWTGCHLSFTGEALK